MDNLSIVSYGWYAVGWGMMYSDPKLKFLTGMEEEAERKERRKEGWREGGKEGAGCLCASCVRVLDT